MAFPRASRAPPRARPAAGLLPAAPSPATPTRACRACARLVAGMVLGLAFIVASQHALEGHEVRLRTKLCERSRGLTEGALSRAAPSPHAHLRAPPRARVLAGVDGIAPRT